MTQLHLAVAALEESVEHILQSPRDAGELKLIVRRPAVDQRETLAQARLDEATGLVGDNWSTRSKVHPEMQLNIMNARVIAAVAQTPERWPLAGDQLFIDLDLSRENLPVGTQIALGDAIIEVTEPPHTGCKKFAARFGVDAMVFVNSGRGRQLNFRGICARVVKSGEIKLGDLARKISQAHRASDTSQCGA
ncbi:MAG: MOSC domain-containing protein [Gammaproteobacteria bacterium]|nr:MOSC domain-containing protein [Gammaproteobacteria bacterium]MDH5304957.1 MOSC domain-containing protein [Gammaproteobacteria bacterium]MDH5322017.1 MOSC domain-containing protein [Gammaproteobacteria bacterium]